MLVVNDEVTEPNQFHRGDSFMRAIVEVFDRGGELLRKGLFNPLTFNSGREPEQSQVFRAPAGNFPDVRCDEEGSVLDDTFAHQRAVAPFREIAFKAARIVTDAELIDESGHETPRERIDGGDF